MYETKIQYNMSFWAKFQNKKVKNVAQNRNFYSLLLLYETK